MVKINEYFEKNYKKELSKYKQFCYLKYKDIDSNEVMDMFNDCYIKLINSKSAQNGTIQDISGYFWMILLNHTSRTRTLNNQNITLNIDDHDISIQNEQLMKEDWLKTLQIRMKMLLTHIEYMIFINYTYNKKMTLKDVAKQISYSQATVYKQNGIMFKKIRQELYDNPDLYYN